MGSLEVAVVLAAAGNGERCFGTEQKQYMEIMGNPLFMYSVEAFLRISCIKKICVVSNRLAYVQNLINKQEEPMNGEKDEKRVIVTEGGASRHASIYNGLKAIQESGSYEIVIIHDGARPIVPEDFVLELIKAASVTGASGATRPLTSTVIRPQELRNTEATILDYSLERDKHLASETPQAFRMNIISEAYNKCPAEELEKGTECLQLVLRHCNISAELIPGPECLWKVTHKKDFYAAEACLKELSTKVCIISRSDISVLQRICDALQDKVSNVEIFITNNGSSTTPANNVVCFHERELDKDGQLAFLADALDTDSPGVIIHVVTGEEEQMSGTVGDFLLSSRTMAAEYEQLKKGVVIVRYTSSKRESKLVQLISSIILADPDTFSGQTFFL